MPGERVFWEPNRVELLQEMLVKTPRKVLLIFGSRDYTPKTFDIDVITRNLPEFAPGNWSILSGGATGVDQKARDYAKLIKMSCVVFPARWTELGRAAGMIRNAEMAAIKPKFSIGFHKDFSPGTMGMADLLEQAGLDYKLINV